jgi:hypothetical protein
VEELNTKGTRVGEELNTKGTSVGEELNTKGTRGGKKKVRGERGGEPGLEGRRRNYFLGFLLCQNYLFVTCFFAKKNVSKFYNLTQIFRRL